MYYVWSIDSTGPQPFPKRVLHTVRSSNSSFFLISSVLLNVIQYLLRPSSSSFRHHCLTVFASVTFLRKYFLCSIIQYLLTHSSSSFRHHYLTIFASITCLRKYFLCNVWPIQLAFVSFIVCRLFIYSLTQRDTVSFLTRSFQLNFRLHIFNCCYNRHPLPSPLTHYVAILSMTIIVCLWIQFLLNTTVPLFFFFKQSGGTHLVWLFVKRTTSWQTIWW
jgi:hypothetical protein